MCCINTFALPVLPNRNGLSLRQGIIFCPWKYADDYFSRCGSLTTVCLCVNLTYVTALCFRPSHVSSVQFTNKSAPAQHRLSSFTTISYLTIQPGALTHQRPSECPIGGVNRSLPCFPREQRANWWVFEMGKHICVSHSSVWLCLPTLSQHSGWATVCIHT